MEINTTAIVTIGLSGTGILGALAALVRVSYSLGRETRRGDELEKRQDDAENGASRCRADVSRNIGEVQREISGFRTDVTGKLSTLSERTGRIEEAVDWLKEDREKNGG